MSTLPESIKEIIRRELAPQQPCLEGWTLAGRGIKMAELVFGIKEPQTLVEIGVFGGRGTIAMALALKGLGGGTCYGIDPWRKAAVMEGEKDAKNIDWWTNLDLEKIHQGCMQSIWRLGLEQHAIIIRSESQHCHQLFNDIDVLNLDGNHNEIASCRDVELYLPRVRKGDGFIFMDDCDWPCTQKAQKMLEVQCECIDSGENGHYKLYRKR